MNIFSLENRHALVTGSTSGIGLAYARGLQSVGAKVLFHGIGRVDPELSDKETVLVRDLLEPEAPAALIEEAFQKAPDLDILVANAGSYFDKDFLKMTPELFDKTLNLNLRAVYFLVQAFARKLVAAKRSGSVVVTCSTNGFQAEDGSSAYDISKGGVLMLTKTLATSLGKYGIRVNAVAPGLYWTPLTRPSLEATPDRVAHYERKIPLGRLGQPEDGAGACVFLASDASSYITGEMIVADGGLTIVQA